MLDLIVTLDKTIVSFYTPETKKQSKQWIKKGHQGQSRPRSIPAGPSRWSWPSLIPRCLIYTNMMPRFTIVNLTYIMKVLVNFLKKKLQRRDYRWSLVHWDNALVPNAAMVQDWLTARGLQVLEHPPYPFKIAPTDIFYLPKVKEELAGLHLT